jgi:nucleoside-diphosphate-sugar epimerase
MASGKRVLVTGISGFLGGHVALALLKQGFAVRGSLRDPGRADQVRAGLREAGADVAMLDFCTLDLLDDRGWAEAAAGCSFLQHVASPFVLTMPKDEDALVRPAVEGTCRAIRAGLSAGHERIVLTSSLAALDGGHRDYDRDLTTRDWTDVDGLRVNAYAKAKTLAEKAAWALMEAEGTREKLSVVNPGTMLGPLLGDDPGTSVAVIQRLLKGEMPMIPNLILPYVDVRDVADAQVAAMIAPDAGGRRHIITNASQPLAEIARLLKESFPERAGKVPKRRLPAWMAGVVALFDKSLRDSNAWLGVVRHYDGSSGINLLGRPLRTTRDAVLASASSLLERKLA